MRTYTIYVKQTMYSHNVEIEANSLKEAKQKVRDDLSMGKVPMDDMSTDFEIKEVSEEEKEMEQVLKSMIEKKLIH